MKYHVFYSTPFNNPWILSVNRFGNWQLKVNLCCTDFKQKSMWLSIGSQYNSFCTKQPQLLTQSKFLLSYNCQPGQQIYFSGHYSTVRHCQVANGN